MNTLYHVSQLLFFVLCGAFLCWLLHTNNKTIATSFSETPIPTLPKGLLFPWQRRQASIKKTRL